MTRLIALSHAALFLGAFQLVPAAEPMPPIEKVEIGANRAFHVNGKPLFPIMAWLQDAENFPAVRACGMNTTAGYWPGSGGTKDVAEYLELVEKAGLNGVMPFDERLKGHPSLLAKEHAGGLYVFAVNYDERLVRTETGISVEGLRAGANVVVVDEARTLRSDAGSFRDAFEPLAVHVYRIEELN